MNSQSKRCEKLPRLFRGECGTRGEALARNGRKKNGADSQEAKPAPGLLYRSVEIAIPAERFRSLCYSLGKLKKSNKSPMAGPFVGTYGLFAAVTGFGKLSRLRLVIGGKLQFLSMNLTMET